ncbi:Hypothetical protein (Fragment) [Durusdinium trenchii]|uniref:Uncharacterized protein n=1 Tax=Durusdinium trenchii TaxID=1381693 RepID=A0ABP0JKR1_9DINO
MKDDPGMIGHGEGWFFARVPEQNGTTVLLLWLLQRPQLRYAPFPYPSVSHVKQWEDQAVSMTLQKPKAITHFHWQRGRVNKVYTTKNLLELGQIRNRAIQEAQIEAAALTRKGEEVDAVRRVVGPKQQLDEFYRSGLALIYRIRLSLINELYYKFMTEQLKKQKFILFVSYKLWPPWIDEIPLAAECLIMALGVVIGVFAVLTARKEKSWGSLTEFEKKEFRAEYHANLQQVKIAPDRKKTPGAALHPAEHKQLRAALGSLQTAHASADSTQRAWGLAAVDPLRCSKASANGALTATTVAVVARHKRVRKILAKAEKEETEDVKDSAESTKTSGFRRWWKKTAKIDAKALRKMGLMCLLSYGFVSNVNALLLILLATYRSILATGASPLASKASLKQFGITWAGLYVISNIVRPVRISIALAISKPFDKLVKFFEEKLKCKRWMAIGAVVLFLNVFLTIALLWGGMILVSSLTGVKVSASQIGVLLKAGKAAKGRDWYLLVGTRQGTLQAFDIAELLSDLPVWSRILAHLPREAAASFLRRPKRNGRRAGKFKVPEENDARLAEIEQEHLDAMELSRAPGQRPFPKHSDVPLFSRWRRHDYAIEVVKSITDRILTIDTKRNLKVCRAEDSRCLFCFQLPDFSCLTPHLSYSQVNAQTGREEEFSLLGVVMGNTRGSLELVELPVDHEDPEVSFSHASHGGAVLQVDFLLPAEIFVSVGEDDTLRFWSSSLYLLREVFFPQACTSVAFMKLPDMDISQGHGDVLVGFAAHVEQMPLDVWARGVKHESLGGSTLESTMRSSQGTSKSSKGTHFSKSAQEDDSAILEELALAWEPPGPEAATIKVEDVIVQTESEEASVPCEVVVEKVRTGAVMDFRGPPVVPLGVLCNNAADMMGVQERLERRMKEMPFGHERSKEIEEGDFESITRYYQGYNDWTVLPSGLLDAPRSYSIRGVTGPDEVAIVTSVGLNLHQSHLRAGKNTFQQPAGVQEEEEEIPEQVEIEEANIEEAEALEESQALQSMEVNQTDQTPPRTASPPSRRVTPLLPERPVSQHSPQNSARRPSSCEGFQSQGFESENLELIEEDEVEETWRNLRIARGVPKRADAPKPVAQNIGNTDADVARMLKERGRLIDAPDDGFDSNFLSRITAKKTDVTYCGVDNLQSARRPARRVIRDPDDDIPEEGIKLWTTTGRLRTGIRQPPQRALPRSFVPLPPQHLWERAPVTRSEVTEMKIIAAAQQPPVTDWAQDLILESAEANKARRQKLPAVPATPRSGSSLTTSESASSAAQFSRVSFALPKGSNF